MKPLPDTTLKHYCELHPIAYANPQQAIDVSGIHPSCIKAMYTRGLIDYQFVQENDKTERRILFTPLGLKYGCEELSLALVSDNINASRKRECLRVYLDMANEDHKQAWEIARSLAGERILTPTLVDLLIMHSEFLNGDDTTLREAYPGIHKLMTETKEQNLFDRLEALIQNAPQSSQNAVSAETSAPKGLQPLGGLKSLTDGIGLKGNLGAVSFAPPSFDDDDDEDMPSIGLRKDTSGSATKNFLASMNALQK